MSIPSPYTAAHPKRRFPAWAFSVVGHGVLILLLLVVLDRAPKGGLSESFHSFGIVLNQDVQTTDSSDGGGGGDVISTASPDEIVEAPQLLPGEPPQPPTPPIATVTTVAQVMTPNSNPLRVAQAPLRTAAPRPGRVLGNGSGGDYARVSVFGVDGTGSKFLYVFDRSASMEGPPLASAKRQLIESLKALDDIHQFHIIFFNQRMKALDISGGAGRVAFATDRNKQLAANFIGGVSADGGTDRYAALRQAFNFHPDVIFFLTDADDPMSQSELEEITKLHEQFGAAICAIEFGRTDTPPQSNFLKDLAARTGGKYGYINAAKLGYDGEARK